MRKTIYRQTNSKWAKLPYPTKASSFGGNGCGACSVLHCIIEQEKYKNWTPKDIQPYMKQHAVAGQGTTWSGIETALKHFGMKNVKWFKRDAKMADVWKELNKKNRIGIILFSAGTGPDGTLWTSGGHYIAFTNYKYENGKHYLYMKDSGDRKHDGWYAYETSMKGRVPQVWTCTVPPEPKPEPTPTPTKKGYTGPFPSIHVTKTAKQAIADGLAWAKIVCADDRFHYGEGGNKVKDFGDDVYKITHQAGCHFCDTNNRKKVKKIKALKRSDLVAKNWEYSTVCNPFVTAILAHGFLEPTILGYCTSGSCVGMDSKGKAPRLDSNKNFKCLGKLSVGKLEKGDVLVKSSHMSMCYAPVSGTKAKITEATSYKGKYGNAASKKSVRIIEKTPTYSNVYRFVGKIDADIIMRCGEYGKRVGDWQDFLNWYFDGKFYKECGGRDNFFGDNTLVWTKKFQEAEVGKGQGDGLVGEKTIKAAKAVKK